MSTLRHHFVTKVSTLAMELSLSEAARLLGKTERQVRYLIQTKQLKARKRRDRWIIRREDLPLSGGQRHARDRKRRRAGEIASQVLAEPAGDEARTSGGKRTYSVRSLDVCELGIEVYRKLATARTADKTALGHLREALEALAVGVHTFHYREKLTWLSRAREHASRAVMALLLAGGKNAAHVERIESSLLPALGGLIRRVESGGSKP